MKGFLLCNNLDTFDKEDSLETYFNHIALKNDAATILVTYSLKKMTLYETNLFRGFIENNPSINKFVIFAPSIGKTAKEDINRLKDELYIGTYHHKSIVVQIYEQPDLLMR